MQSLRLEKSGKNFSFFFRSPKNEMNLFSVVIPESLTRKRLKNMSFNKTGWEIKDFANSTAHKFGIEKFFKSVFWQPKQRHTKNPAWNILIWFILPSSEQGFKAALWHMLHRISPPFLLQQCFWVHVIDIINRIRLENWTKLISDFPYSNQKGLKRAKILHVCALCL